MFKMGEEGGDAPLAEGAAVPNAVGAFLPPAQQPEATAALDGVPTVTPGDDAEVDGDLSAELVPVEPLYTEPAEMNGDEDYGDDEEAPKPQVCFTLPHTLILGNARRPNYHRRSTACGSNAHEPASSFAALPQQLTPSAIMYVVRERGVLGLAGEENPQV